MIKKVIFILCSFALVSCSTTRKENKDLGELKDQDFVRPKAQKYNYREDYITHAHSTLFPLLSDESMERYTEGEKENIEEKSNELDKLMALCHLKKSKEAFELADNIYLKNSENPIYWNSVGLCFFYQQDYRKAQLYFNKALGKEKNYAPAMNNIGVLYRMKNEDQKALEAFKTAKIYNRFSQTPKFNIAQLYLEYGLIDKAFSEFIRMKKMAPNDMDVRAALATAYLLKKEFRQAVNEFESLPEKIQEREDVVINYALSLYYSGNKEKARDIIKDANIKDTQTKEYYSFARKVVMQ